MQVTFQARIGSIPGGIQAALYVLVFSTELDVFISSRPGIIGKAGTPRRHLLSVIGGGLTDIVPLPPTYTSALSPLTLAWVGLTLAACPTLTAFNPLSLLQCT